MVQGMKGECLSVFEGPDSVLHVIATGALVLLLTQCLGTAPGGGGWTMQSRGWYLAAEPASTVEVCLFQKGLVLATKSAGLPLRKPRSGVG